MANCTCAFSSLLEQNALLSVQDRTWPHAALVAAPYYQEGRLASRMRGQFLLLFTICKTVCYVSHYREVIIFCLIVRQSRLGFIFSCRGDFLAGLCGRE